MTTELIRSVVNKTCFKPIEKDQLFCYLVYWLTDLPYSVMGKVTNKTRVNAFHSVRVIKNRIKTEKGYFRKVDDLIRIITYSYKDLQDAEKENEELMRSIKKITGLINLRDIFDREIKMIRSEIILKNIFTYDHEPF